MLLVITVAHVRCSLMACTLIRHDANYAGATVPLYEIRNIGIKSNCLQVKYHLLEYFIIIIIGAFGGGGMRKCMKWTESRGTGWTSMQYLFSNKSKYHDRQDKANQLTFSPIILYAIVQSSLSHCRMNHAYVPTYVRRNSTCDLLNKFNQNYFLLCCLSVIVSVPTHFH